MYYRLGEHGELIPVSEPEFQSAAYELITRGAGPLPSLLTPELSPVPGGAGTVPSWRLQRPTGRDHRSVTVKTETAAGGATLLADNTANRWQILIRNEAAAVIAIGVINTITFAGPNVIKLNLNDSLVLDDTKPVYAVRDPAAAADGKVGIIEETY